MLLLDKIRVEFFDDGWKHDTNDIKYYTKEPSAITVTLPEYSNIHIEKAVNICIIHNYFKFSTHFIYP